MLPAMSQEEKPVILVADDEVHILHVVSLKLRNAGYQVVTAQDGQEALSLCLQCRPALVITDYQMPVMSGLTLCLKLAGQPATAHIPALMLTARGFALNDDDLRRTHIVDVLSKPFSPRELLGRVEQLIHKATVES